LLDRLTADKLKSAAEEIAAEGWKWIEVAVSLPYGVAYGCGSFWARRRADEDERTAMEALQAERDKLENEYETAEELPEEIDRRLGEIETALENFEKRPLDYDPVEVARAGAFVSIAADGALSVDRGYVRPVDEPPVTPRARTLPIARL